MTTRLCRRCAQQRPTDTIKCPTCLERRKALARERAAVWYARNQERHRASTASHYYAHHDEIAARRKCRRVLGHAAPDPTRSALAS